MTLPFKTKNEAVYETLRHDIIDGKLKPGEKIVVSNLAKEFGFSEIPIREAIKKLESEGLLQLTPHVGTMVSKIDGKEVIEIYLIRTELESLAAKLATPHLNEADLDFLEKKIQEMEFATSQKNYEKMGALNKDFHLRIYRAAPYPYLFKLIVDLWEKVHRTRGVFALVPERAIASIEEHKKILAAIRNKQASLVARLVREQKKSSMKAITDYLIKNKDLM
jgi:DNA-binding GntR family transcriptional regulator